MRFIDAGTERPDRGIHRFFGALWMCAALAACGGGGSNSGAGIDPGAQIEIKTLSGRPDTVSGGDSLVRVGVRNAVLQNLRVELNGQDVTKDFHTDPAGSSMTGLVSNLKLGDNTLKGTVDGRSAQLTLVNHPLAGPIISGPHQEPFVCQTELFGLGPALDADCNAKVRVEYVYRTTAPLDLAVDPFKVLDPDSPRPADLAQTTTSTGKTVPYIVRRETGTINRAVYQIAFLHEPGAPLPAPGASIPGWNNRLVYSFGGGCKSGYRQGDHAGTGVPGTFWGLPNGVPTDVYQLDYVLRKGYATAVSSLNVFGNNCNEVLSAETMMMVKEYFIKRYGPPVYTIGNGPSGGSMQQHLVAPAYPGLVDGILPTVSYPDSLTSLVTTVPECLLLARTFDTSNLSWSDAQKTAVAGFSTWNFCEANGSAWQKNTLVATNCDSSLPSHRVYDATNNPRGTRCTYADNLKNIYGTNPETGFARRPLDNVGVQYGLDAFNKGAIDFDHFLDLNARMGGFDIDGGIQPTRMEADPIALDIAYQTGRLNNGGGGLAMIPIIDIRSYNDDTDDLHDAVRTDIVRARLVKANGSAGNHVRLLAEGNGKGVSGDIDELTSPVHQAVMDALDAIDAWLANIAADSAPAATPLEKVTRNKPKSLVDACYMRSGARNTDFADCLKQFPSHSNPRLAAGAPLSQDVLKCTLKPIVASDYSQALTDVQLASLNAAFPNGVCDYSRPGVGQVPFTRTWLAFPQPGLGTRLDDLR